MKKRVFAFGAVLFLFMIGKAVCFAEEGGYREFLNDRNRPEADYSQDNREVFRIIEVIPHDACSIFPYMIDWKTEEEYNRNVPIGYEGLVYGATHSGNVQIFEPEKSTPSKAYAVVEDGLKRDFLTSYEVEFTTKYNKNNGYWWREDNTNSILKENGYFEYVGEGKGLYYINTSMITGEDKAENGINHELQAVPRSGKEEKSGEYDVKEPRYYWAQDYNGDVAFPTTDIESRTGFNYDMIFRNGEKRGAYRAYEVSEKTETAAGEEGAYDYFVKVKAGAEKNYDFVKHKGGNYAIRDGGFVHVGIGKGGYIIENNGIFSSVSWSSQDEIIFEYAGEGLGIYDVSFIYAADDTSKAALYSPEIRRVSNGTGRYALTSASRDSSAPGNAAAPEYVKSDAGDYSNIITYIDFAGIDYTDKTNGYYATTQPYGAGVRIGRTISDYGTEMGGWVFHEMEDVAGHGYTKLKDVAGKKAFEAGDRIYVNGQSRIYRYYCRNSFRNNEWFKLLCYLDNPGNPSLAYSDNSNGMGYDTGKTSAENLVKAKNILKSFDNTFRIEVLQRTPGEVTKEEVESAALIYISDAAGIESIVQEWNNISGYLEDNGQSGLKPLPSRVGNSNDFRFEDDFKNDVLLAIYDRCIYKNEGALMATVGLREHYMENKTYTAAVQNLGKLTFFMDLMEDARDFAYFIEGYEETSDTFSLIHQDDEGDTLGIELWSKQQGHDKYGSLKDMYNVARDGESGIERCFHIDHFEAPREAEEAGITVSWKGSEYTGHSSVGTVLEGETKYYSHWYSVSSFNGDELHKIWQILHNRKNKGKIVVQITNASLTYGDDKKRVIYADEFYEESFNIKYKILLRGAIIELSPALSDTRIFFDDNDNGVWDEGELFYMNAGQQYNTEDKAHERNVRSGFEDASSNTDPKLLNPDLVMRKAVVQASDVDGKTGYADVWVTVREGFDLN